MTTRATTPAGRRRASARTKPAARKPAAKKQGPRKPAATKRATRKSARARSRLRRAAPKPVAARKGRRLGSWRVKGALALVLAGVLAIAYFAWFRDSSLVAVNDVKIDGLEGGSSNPAAAALVAEAKEMTTLHVDQGRLDQVAARFPEIASVSTEASFPHGMTIHVTQRPPVMVARSGGDDVPIAGDGTLLRGDDSPELAKLPAVAVDHLPASGRLSGSPRGEALVLGAAPAVLAREVTGVGASGSHGVTVKLHGGIQLRFGTPAAARAKWTAAAAVLADKRVTSLSYVDVQVPKRPALG